MGIGGAILGGFVGFILGIVAVALLNYISPNPSGAFTMDSGLIIGGTTILCALFGLLKSDS